MLGISVLYVYTGEGLEVLCEDRLTLESGADDSCGPMPESLSLAKC